MSVKKEIFSDGIGQIHFNAGMVRYDFVTLQPTEEGQAPVAEASARIVMPVRGFLAAFDSMRQLIDKLVDAGVLKKEAPEQPAPKAKAKAKAKSKKK